MKIGHSLETGQPIEDGVYVAEVYFGWKILSWRAGEWWHEDFVGRWASDVPLQWVGPLPPRARMPGQKPAETPDKVFDL